MYCMLKTPPYFYFFKVLKKKCRLLLLVVLLINSVTNKCISHALSTFNLQHFLLMEFLRLNVSVIFCLRLSKNRRRHVQYK